MFNIFKQYRSNDQQQDIFKDKYQYILDIHQKANKQYLKLLPIALSVLMQRLLGKIYPFPAKKFDDLLISIDPTQGKFLYSNILSTQPKILFEFGLSSGVSAIYIIQALKELGYQAQFYSAELSEKKIQLAKANLKYMDCLDYVTILAGDIRENYHQLPENIDFVHMDGFPNINLEVFKLIEAKLSRGALIITDDLNLFRYEMQDYIDYFKNNCHYSTIELPISDGVLISVKKT